MAWLKDHGLISCYDDYVGLPLAVLEDARELMDADVKHAQFMEARHRNRR